MSKNSATSERLSVAIVGCGLIGQKRARTLRNIASVRVCCDVQIENAMRCLSDHPDASISTDWSETVVREDIDAVCVCTTHDLLAPISEAAVAAGKHVLVEKPGAISSSQLDRVRDAAERTGAHVRVGFNHRYHRSLRKARDIVDSGALGDLLYIRSRYGHGGRMGYEKEWRANPSISGGGEAIDQGVHLLDLVRWFLGDLRLLAGSVPTYFWNMPVEDNAFFLLETPTNQVAFLHASWTEWKNLFSFEICGKGGKLEITGLGGSYGTERLAHYQMLPDMGPPPTTIYEFPMADDSWDVETREFLLDIDLNRKPSPGIADAQAALRIVEDLYRRTRS